MCRLEVFCSKVFGKFVFGLNCNDLHHDIFFFLILTLVFVSRMLVCDLWRGERSPVWAAHVFTFFCFIAVLQSSMTTSECSPGNDPAQNEDASSSGTETITPDILEKRFVAFISQFGRKAPQQRIFDSFVENVKLHSAPQADLVELNRIIQVITNSKHQFQTPGEAVNCVVNHYDSYYFNKYGKHL